ncbi:unnamed protein product [marine sediment metagenome]|uniref:Uncharacterized protein n=1 Tax=marine sediment metagenome TaxID=412755 RepID=X0VF96_9ZZZZ
MTGFGKVDDGLDIDPFGPVADRIGLRADDLAAMAQQTSEGIKKLSDLWGV